MSIFDGQTTMTHEEAIEKLVLDQKTRIVVSDILSGKNFRNGEKYVMCLVSNVCRHDGSEVIRIIVDYSKDREGYLDSYSGYKDIDGCTWEYASAINMDGTIMTVYDYKMTRLRGK